MTQLCYGIVTEVKNKPLRVKAVLPEYDDMITPWMLVLQPRTLGTRHYDPPVKDEQVACLMLDDFETGLCLGSVYSDADLEPVEGEQFYREFSDGTVLSYNPETHELQIENVVNINVKATNVLFDAEVVTMSKKLIVGEDVIIAGQSFIQHLHQVPPLGNASTTPPVPTT